MSRLTIKDIAALAGVSRTTASRVLNGRGEVRSEVRARVEQVIADTGYRPLASAKSLVSQRTGVVGFVVPLGASALFDDPYFGVLIRGITRASAQHGITVALFIFDEEGDQDTLIDQVVGPRRVDGLIVSAFHTRESLIDRLSEFDVPVVTMGPNPYPAVFGSVSVDNLEGGRIAGRHMATLGRLQIAMINGPEDTPSGRERREGFIAGLGESGIVVDPKLIREGDYTRRSGEVRMRELLPLSPRAVFVASDTMAVGALAVLAEHGMRVPEDVAVLGFDDLPSASDSGLSTVRQPIVEVADAALEILLQQVSDPESTKQIVMPVELVQRGSTALS
ncbi:LacI family DNA-binding transcriptional regulator [Microbacterium atlanticum]|uniref:LacI family DNA-binding transcriptional regulator n=1 Tax=Microbacterium atlanticum TaxID=2782168 RepID=UPI00188955F4|nr:LacI family DNA-binding transcriptional regulator [Microbacterium atlanticum]